MKRRTKTASTRRDFLKCGGAAFLAAGVASLSPAPGAAKEPAAAEKGPEVRPVEDLMREHGVLRRLLLIYGEIVRRLSDPAEALKPQIVTDSAKIIRSFIEDYHEKLEEDYLFPRFKKAGVQASLVDVLLSQHRAGRIITERITTAASTGISNPENKRRLIEDIGLFTRMYRPHAAREDTVLFPAFHAMTRPSEYDELGETFENEERRLYGTNGFENIVGRVAGLEQSLGIYELSQFTP